MSDTAKLPRKERTPEQIAEERRVREAHRLNPIRDVPADTLSGADATQLLQLVASIRREREALGLSPEQLAERAGLEVATLHRLESGQSFNPTIATLFRLAAALGKHLTVGLDATSAGPIR
jgi:ribosome-binding protein aMBF1 (putative translation factor)